MSLCLSCQHEMTPDDDEADEQLRCMTTDFDYDDPRAWRMLCIKCHKRESEQQRRDDMTAYTTCG